MAVDLTVRKAQDVLKLSKLKSKLPRDPKLVDIQVEDYVDTDGEDALRVTVVLDEDVDVEKVDDENVTIIIRTIHDRIRAAGIDRWPYTHFVKPSELLEDDDEE